jgi:hypothetical protein
LFISRPIVEGVQIFQFYAFFKQAAEPLPCLICRPVFQTFLTPSLDVCRAEKMKRAMKQQRESGASETGSADRDSTEFKQVPSLPPADPPERGILKKSSSRTSVEGGKRSRAISHAAPVVELDSRDKSSVYDNGDKQATDEQLKFIDGDAEEDQCSYCDCSVEEDSESVKDVAGTLASVACKSGCNQETQTDLESAESSLSRGSLYGDSSGRLARLCNINELLRQIDEQFNNVLRATTATAPYTGTAADLSPTNSEDFRGSETEADRACAGFYRQSDAEASRPIAEPLSAAQKLDRPGLSHSLQSSSVDVTTQGQPRPASALELPSRLSFKPLALPHVPKLHEIGCSPEKETDEQWRPRAFVPYRGLSTSSDASRWDGPSASATLPLCAGASSSPATVPSEGYHSDRGGTSEPDGPIILREIPLPSRSAVQFTPDDGVCDNTTLSAGLLHSPDDVDV